MLKIIVLWCLLTGAAALAAASDKPMSLNVQDIELRALLQIFARFGHTNIVASDSIKGNITVDLRDLSWQQALDVVLQSKGLASRRRRSSRIGSNWSSVSMPLGFSRKHCRANSFN